MLLKPHVCPINHHHATYLAATAQLLQQTHNKLRTENLIFVDNAATQRRKLSSYLEIAELCIIISMRLSLYVIFTFPHIR